MNVLVGLIPAVGWGFQPIISQKTGGKPINQLIGTTLACFVIGCFIFVTLFLSTTPGISIDYFVPIAFWCNFIKGILWCCGMICIFKAFTILGVAKTGPLSTGVQLVYTTIMGIALFRENYNDKFPWQGIVACVGGLLVAMIGMLLVSWKPKTKGAKKMEHHKTGQKQILFLVFLFFMAMVGNGSFFVFSNIPVHYYGGHFATSASYIDDVTKNISDPNGLYTAMFHILQPGQLNFYDSVYSLSCMFPLGIGMLIGSIAIGVGCWLLPAMRKHNKVSWQQANRDCPFIQGATYYSVLAGIAFGVASLGILYSTQQNGVALASLLGQLNVLILSICGLFIFHEKKSKREYITLFSGLGLVTIGCMLPTFINSYILHL